MKFSFSRQSSKVKQSGGKIPVKFLEICVKLEFVLLFCGEKKVRVKRKKFIVLVRFEILGEDLLKISRKFWIIVIKKSINLMFLKVGNNKIKVEKQKL